MATITRASTAQEKYDAMLAAMIAGDVARRDTIWALMTWEEILGGTNPLNGRVYPGMEVNFASRSAAEKQALKAAINSNPKIVPDAARSRVDKLLIKVVLPSPSQAPMARAAGLAALPSAAMPPNPILRPTYTAPGAPQPINLMAAADALRRGATNIASMFARPSPEPVPMPYAAGGSIPLARAAVATAYAPAPQVDRVAAAKSSTGAAIAGNRVTQAQAGVRTQALQGDLVNVLQFAARETGVTVRVFSGGQPAKGEGGPRTGSTRHDHGNAADVNLFMNGRMLSSSNPADLPIIEAFMAASVRAGATGLGAGVGNNYMGPNAFHVGFGSNGVKGGPVVLWGGTGKNAGPVPDWLKRAGLAPYSKLASLGLPIVLPQTVPAKGGGVTIPGMRTLARDIGGGASVRKGDRGERVAAVQQFLASRGYYKDDIDGIAGNRTREAIKAFQAERGLKQDGIVGQRTVAAMVREQQVPQPVLRPDGTLTGEALATGSIEFGVPGVAAGADPDSAAAARGFELFSPGYAQGFPVEPGNFFTSGLVPTVEGGALPVTRDGIAPVLPSRPDFDLSPGYNQGYPEEPGTPFLRGAMGDDLEEELDPEMMDLYNALNPPYYEEFNSGYYAPAPASLGGDFVVLDNVNSAFSRASREAAAERHQEERFSPLSGSDQNSLMAGLYGDGGYSYSTPEGYVQNVSDASYAESTSGSGLSVEGGGPGGGPGDGSSYGGPGGGPGSGGGEPDPLTDIQENGGYTPYSGDPSEAGY